MFVTMKRKQILTTTATLREDRNKKIIEQYKSVYVKGSHVTAIAENIAADLGVKFSTAYKVIKKHRDSIAVSLLIPFLTAAYWLFNYVNV